jgi:gluconolactonase
MTWTRRSPSPLRLAHSYSVMRGSASNLRRSSSILLARIAAGDYVKSRVEIMQCGAGNWWLGWIVLGAVSYGCSGASTPSSPGSGSSSGGGSGSASSGSSGSSGSSSGVSTGSSGGASASGSGSTSSSSGGTGDDGGSSGSSSDGGSRDSGGGVKTYPPLKFSDIGQPALISGQFYFTEGPVWDPNKNVLYFTDINAQQAGKTVGAIYRLTLPSTIDVFFQPDGNADGIGLDPQGNIIAAGFVSRNVWRLSNNTMQTLAACSSPATATCYQSKEINTPDDITSRSDGVIYFTDPTFASGGQGFPTQSLPLSQAQGVYRLTKDGTLHLEDTSTQGPNGVNLSPDEKTLYVAYTTGNSVSKFNVAADGSLSNKQMFASGTSLADSMCVDAGGNVYVGTSGGLAVFNPAGQSQGTINVAGQLVTNCAFGGADQRTLFITSRAQSTLVGTPVANDSSLYKVDNMPVPGIPGQN